MKKLIALLLSAIIIFSISACSISGDESMDEVIDKKAIVMGFDKGYMPMGFTDDNGTYAGFDLDLAKAICKRIITPAGTQATLNIMPLNGQNAVDGVLNGAVDFLANSLSIHGEGSEKLSYSYSLFENNQVLVVLNESSFNTKEDLNSKKIAVVSDSVSAEALEGDSSFMEKVTVLECEDINKAVSELETSAADAVIMDEVCAKYLITKGKQLRILNDVLKSDSYKLAFNSDSKALINKINSILKELEKDSTLEELSTKWFGENIIEIK